ncbi:E3 SUMO-protein ligase MMS21 isoform X1 [Panicum miliaceum]|uniref:E3 SUMO-protein ligase MMS21 isoform X1 n=1 Tax=Panicum miliaceum TaxID=4540 RepID=A0A3L6R7V3_PANMI|nr:E3 SUMO-protein ligase MMS21 isoform X1 [Panicum miliaceum]
MSSVTTKLSNTAAIALSEVQALVADMRKALGSMKSLAFEYERDGKSDKAHTSVHNLEEMVLEMVASYEHCTALTQAIKAVPEVYQPSDQPTDFKTLIEAEVNKIKEASSASGQNHPLFRQFRESVWNVHHAGQPMPGEEQEDIVMTSTQMSILNVTCPLTGKPVIELVDPVRCVDCRHIYEKGPVMHYIRSKKPPQCPIAGCPRVLQIGKFICDPLLRIEIDELRSSEPAVPNATNIEDFTDLLDEDDE